MAGPAEVHVASSTVLVPSSAPSAAPAEVHVPSSAPAAAAPAQVPVPSSNPAEVPCRVMTLNLSIEDALDGEFDNYLQACGSYVNAEHDEVPLQIHKKDSATNIPILQKNNTTSYISQSVLGLYF